MIGLYASIGSLFLVYLFSCPTKVNSLFVAVVDNRLIFFKCVVCINLKCIYLLYRIDIDGSENSFGSALGNF